MGVFQSKNHMPVDGKVSPSLGVECVISYNPRGLYIYISDTRMNADHPDNGGIRGHG